jgi:hypothetical protein
MSDLTAAIACVVEAINRHVAHGYGEITVSIKPGNIRVQEGAGHIFDLPRPQR